jgi:septum formation inhibitor MinC
MHTGHAAVAAVSPELQLRFAEGVPVLCLPEEAAFVSQDFEVLRAWVRERLPEHVGAIQGRTVRLDLGRRDIKLFDLRRLVHLVKQEFSLEVTGLYLRPAAVHKFAERELKLKLFVEDGGQPAFSDDQDTEEATAKAAPADVLLAAATLPHDLLPEDIAPAVVGAAPPPPPDPATDAEPAATRAGGDERKTQSVHRTLRSGSTVRFDGDLFVFGDVNPGAQVIATGNITVLGALTGMEHPANIAVAGPSGGSTYPR